MDDHLTKAQHCRDRAENMRALAAKEDDETARDALVALAETYDKLGQKFLAMAASRRNETVIKFKR